MKKSSRSVESFTTEDQTHQMKKHPPGRRTVCHATFLVPSKMGFPPQCNASHLLSGTWQARNRPRSQCHPTAKHNST